MKRWLVFEGDKGIKLDMSDKETHSRIGPGTWQDEETYNIGEKDTCGFNICMLYFIITVELFNVHLCNHKFSVIVDTMHNITDTALNCK